MERPAYERRKVRRAMLLAPLAALLGILPYIVQLNLTISQYLLAALAALVVCYVLGLVLGGPGYLLLTRLGYSKTVHLMGYAVVLVIAATIAFSDVYVLVSLGPPILLGAGAFCYLRGQALDPEQAETS